MAVLHATVTGNVQGVGFRWYVRGRARRFEVTGRATNLRDGSVEVVAEGARDVLERFVAALDEGPGRIDRVVHVISEGALGLDDFTMD
jgi:acylphosphatase